MPSPDAIIRSAHAAALAVVSPAVAKAAQDALAAVQARSEATLLREAVADLAALAKAADWQVVLDQVAQAASALVSQHGADAMRWGYEARMAEDVADFNLEFTWGNEDADTLAAYPVQGHRIADHARERGQALRFDLSGAINSASAQGMASSAIPDQVQAVALRFADSFASLIDEAWHAGQTAAVLAVGGALAEEVGSAGA